MKNLIRELTYYLYVSLYVCLYHCRSLFFASVAFLLGLLTGFCLWK